MGKLKIGFVLDDTLDTPDGVQQYVLALGAWLSAAGHDVHYLVGHTERTDIPNVHSLSRNVKVQFNGNRMSTPLPASKRQIRELLKREKFDVLHVQIPYSPFMAGRVILAAPKSTAIIGTFHIAPNSGLVKHANTMLGHMVGRSLKRIDTVVSVSRAAAVFAKATHGIETTILPNVVNAQNFKTAKPFEFERSLPTIVFLGRLVPRKGCKVLLEAVSIMRSDTTLPDFRVVICGKGELRDKLEQYVRKNNLSNMITFVGFVNDKLKASYLRAADIAVFPSTGGESFGIVLTEAMAADHPVVLGADNDGYRTVLEPYPNVLFPILDPISLANKLKIYLTDPTARSKALAWQKSTINQYDVATVGPKLVARYYQALRSK
jgi:phosphatidylinositol alpha-mannosyltransferase